MSHEHCQQITDESDFAKEIAKAIREGFDFVPFVGAGFSVPSGIPDTPAMYRYLEYCMLAAFGMVPERRRIPWSPRKEPWPSLAAWKSDDLPTSGRLRQIWQQALSNYPTNLILREAFGSLADWRSTLRFISRIDSVDPSPDEGKIAEVHLGASDPSIVDSFFRALMEHRRPALTHKMLHSLSTVMRCDVLLTTNFDDLIERAFQEAGSPLSVYEVPSNDPLPSAGLVLRERTLIKLHGGKFWLRADDTLDEPPSREDVRNFLGYLAGRPLRSNPQAVGDDLNVVDQMTALLVCGLSAKDTRIKHLLAYALAWMPQLKIFWLGYASPDVDSANEVSKLAHEYSKTRSELRTPASTAESVQNRVIVHLCPNAGLFCLRLFQNITQALPPSGAIFPSLWKLAAPPEFFLPLGYDVQKRGAFSATDEEAQEFSKLLRKLRLHIKNNFRSYSRGDSRATLAPVLVEVGHDAEKNFSGGLSLAQQLHNERNWGRPEEGECADGFLDPVRAIWVDLVDVVQPAGFFLRLSLIIANSCGDHDPISRLNMEDYYGDQCDHEEFCRSIADNITRVTRESGAIWLVTVNAKEAPGCNSLFDHECYNSKAEMPKDSEDNRWQDVAFSSRFADTVEYLIEQRRLPIQFVFVTHTNRLSEVSHVCVRSLWVMFGSSRRQSWAIDQDLLQLPTVEKLVEHAISRIHKSYEKSSTSSEDGWKPVLRYLVAYAIAVFRIARYRVALREILHRLSLHLVDSGIQVPLNTSKLEEFFDRELRMYCGDPRPKTTDNKGLGLVRQKQGGFLWMHLKERQALLRQLHTYIEGHADGRFRRIIAILTLRLHWYVARWYGRLLLSSLDPMAVSQGVDHVFRGIEYAAANSATLFSANDDVGNTAKRLLIAMIRHARHVLGVAEPLFGRRLSDQFANLALEALLQKGLHLVRKFIDDSKLRPSAKKVFFKVEEELKQVELQVLRMYSTLQRRSGRFSTIPGKKSVRELLNDVKERAKSGNIEIRAIEMDLANCLICSRHYIQAADQLSTTLSEIMNEDVGLRLASENESTVKELCSRILNWSVGLEPKGTRPSESSIGEAVQVLEKLMYLEMHRSQSRYLARESAKQMRCINPPSPRETPQFVLDALNEVLAEIDTREATQNPIVTPKEERCQLLGNAREWGEAGLALLRHLAINDGQKVYYDNVRLRSHAALCEALLAANLERDAGLELMAHSKRLLAEAQAYLDEFPLKHAGKLRAVFELRCAEISILEASVVITKQTEPSQHATAPYKEVFAHVYDALRAIKRAEVVLDEHRKSRWWWWILLVLKVKACEYLYHVRLLRIQEWANSNSGKEEILELTRLLPPYALQFLRDELDMKTADVQMTDPMFLARIVHSFRMICRYDLEFEKMFCTEWKRQRSKEQLPGGRGDLPRVRLTHARATLRSLAAKLEKVVLGIKKLNERSTNNDEWVDLDTLNYAEIVKVQAKWDVERELIWKN